MPAMQNHPLSTLFAAAVVSFAGAASAGGAVLVQYDFENSPTDPNVTSLDADANSTASVFGIAGGNNLGNSGIGDTGAFPFTTPFGNPTTPGATGDTDSDGDSIFTETFDTTTEAAAVAADDYYGFTITRPASRRLNLADVRFAAAKTNTNSADQYAVFYSTDGFAGFTGADTANTKRAGGGSVTLSPVGASSDWEDEMVTFSGATDLTDVQMRIYVWGEDAATGDAFRIDKVLVNGESVVPEPASAGLLGAAAVAGLLSRRRRRRA